MAVLSAVGMGSSGGGTAVAVAARRMDPKVATELARKVITLLLLGMPHHTVLGVNTQVLSAGPRFRGMKMVPPSISSTTAPPAAARAMEVLSSAPLNNKAIWGAPHIPAVLRSKELGQGSKQHHSFLR